MLSSGLSFTHPELKIYKMKKLVFILGAALMMPMVHAQESHERRRTTDVQKEIIIIQQELNNLNDISAKVRAIITESIEEGTLELNEEVMRELEIQLNDINEQVEIVTDINDATIKREKIVVIKTIDDLHHDGELKRHFVKKDGCTTLSENVRIEVIEDDQGNTVTRKWVNDEEVPFSEEDMNTIQLIELKEGQIENLEQMIEKEIIFELSTLDTVEVLEHAINPNIKNFKIMVHIDDDGKEEVSVVKWVDGEKVELSDKELEELKSEHSKFMKFDIHSIPPPPVEVNVDRKNVEGPDVDIVLDNDLTIDELDVNALEIQLSPNPTRGYLDYHLISDGSSDLTVKVISQLGVVIETLKIDDFSGDFNHRFDLKDQPSGIYIIHTQLGEKMGVSKVMLK